MSYIQNKTPDKEGMDYEVKIKDELSGKKLARKLNIVRTASVIEDFTQLGAFEVLYGSL